MLIYKILRPAEWTGFAASGRFDGSPDDLADGYIHCSTRTQVARTARRYFAAEPALVVLAVDAELLGDALRWEAGGSGDHIYGPLLRSAVVEVHEGLTVATIDEAL